MGISLELLGAPAANTLRGGLSNALIAMLILLIAANLAGLVTVVKTLFMSDLSEAMDMRDLFSSFGYLCRTVAAVLFVITLLLLIIILIIVTITACNHSWSISSRQDSKEDLP
ncbi:uncharacterized protein LOC135438503 isoform X2 [Drosophila montana]|uniref:uncharacterized protein LOC135438503 isoform X2 n=1 Tax=Drosophila montana TaxID=40370 RepID=UPI00313D74E5